MTNLSAQALKAVMVRVRARFREIDHADWDPDRRIYHTPDTQKWEQATADILRTTPGVHPAEWLELVRILAHGWDYYGGSDLPGEGRM